MKTVKSELFIESIRLKDDIEAELYEEFPLNINALRFFETLKFKSPVTVFAGSNGCGKSTLIEGIADKLGIPINGGSTNLSAKIQAGVTTENEGSPLAKYLILGKTPKRPYRTFFFRAESFHEISSVIDNDEDIDRDNYLTRELLTQSHGESFIDLMERQFIRNSLYILDEPEAALSPQNQLKLLTYIDELSKLGTQFIIATHSPFILGYRNADIVNLDNGINRVEFKETETYYIYKRFLEDPEGFQNNFLT